MRTVHARTVRRAAEIVGGNGLLAQHLDVENETFIRKWQAGELSVAQEIFLRCDDIVHADQLDDLSGPEPKNFIPKAPG